jgi:hypothetical protein
VRSRRISDVEAIRPDRSDRTLKWETRRLEDLLERVIPHFERFPILSGKRREFERFAAVCKLMAGGGHRTRSGLADIVELARFMNPSAPTPRRGSTAHAAAPG